MKSGLHLMRRGSNLHNTMSLRRQSTSLVQFPHNGILGQLVVRKEQHRSSTTVSLIRLHSKDRCFSSDTAASSPPSERSKFAAVDHSEAYEMALQGPHGQQLALARLEGIGKDDPPFDPFLEDELAALEENEDDEDAEYLEEEDDEDDDKKDHGDNVLEAEYVNGEEEDEEDDDDYEEDDDDDYDESEESLYNRDGSVRRKKSVLATLRAGFPSGGLFAVIELGGIQHKVTTDDLIIVNRLKPVDHYKIGSVHTLTDILLVGSSHKTLVGIPTVTGAEVDVMVEEITRDAKVIIFKKRRRKNSQRKNGFRRDITMLRVLDVRMPEAYKDHKHVSRDIVDELATATDELNDSTTTSSGSPLSFSGKAPLKADL